MFNRRTRMNNQGRERECRREWPPVISKSYNDKNKKSSKKT